MKGKFLSWAVKGKFLYLFIFYLIILSLYCYQGAFLGLLSGVALTLTINAGYSREYPHREYLNTTVNNCSFLGNDTAREIPQDP